MPRSFDLYLDDMLRAGREIEKFLSGRSLDDYLREDMLHLAVERLFEILGEAVSQSRRYYPEEEPVSEAERSIMDFRNRIIHGYFGINDEVVWSTAKVFLPEFLSEVAARIAQRKSEVRGQT